MIRNDRELAASQESIGYFQRLLLQLRVTARPEVLPAVASGYPAGIEKMQQKGLVYLTRHASQTTPAEVV
jgi:hypothetical protein